MIIGVDQQLIYFARYFRTDVDLGARLERDAVIETKGYRGTYVHPKAKTNCKINLQELALRKLSATVAELREVGITDPEIRNAFASAISQRIFQ
jgi:GntR family transcriptional regulator